MTFGDFYDIAEFGNANWKGNFSPKEIAENAYEYFGEFLMSKCSGETTTVIVSLLGLLDEDRSEIALEYANMIREEIKESRYYV